MAQETDVPLCIFQARVVLVIHGTILACLSDISIYDNCTVQGNLYLIALEHDLFGIPFSHRFQKSPSGRDNAIHRAMVLVWFEIFINIRPIIQHLDLHTHISCIAPQRCPYTDATVASRSQLEIESELTKFPKDYFLHTIMNPGQRCCLLQHALTDY